MSHVQGPSPALRLMALLYDAGVVKRGAFNWLLFRHDEWCPALLTRSPLDCACDVEGVLDGKVYSLRELERRQ